MASQREQKRQRTTSSSSTSTMSKALRAAMKMMQVTPSKQWIHFFLSDLWPPTSNILRAEGDMSWLTSAGIACAPALGPSLLPEVEIFEGELGLDDTGGLHS